MTVTSSPPAPHAKHKRPHYVGIWVVLGALTAAAGYALRLHTLLPGQYPASSTGATWWVMLHALLGTSLVAGGTSALNMVVERDVDALMHRTAHRPLPAGRITLVTAWTFSWTLNLLAALQLLLFAYACPGA